MSLLDLVAGAHEKTLRPSGGCHNCPRRRVGFVPSTLQQGPVLFLGETPTENDVAAGVAFGGKSGELLRQVARECGVPEPWSFSYTVHCRPPTPIAGKAKEVSCCLSQFVLDEIRGYPIIVLCGSVALQAFFPGANAAHFRGNVAWHPDFPGQRFYAMWSPAAIIRRPELRDSFTQQMQRLARIARGEAAPSWTLHRGAHGLEVLRRLVEQPLLSLDFETNQLEAWKAGGRIKSLAVTADGTDVVVGHEDEPTFDAMLQLLAGFVQRPEKSILGQHIGFDLTWLEQLLGVHPACTLVFETGVLWYQAKQYKMPSLKELVSRELDGYRYLVHQPHLVRDVELLLQYNAEDVVYPLQLMRRAMQLLPPKTRDLTARVLGPADWVLTRMSAAGIYLRADYRQQKIDEYRERRRQAIAVWKDEDPEFVPSVHESGDGLLTYLYEIRRLPILERTDGGQPSTDKSVLKQLVRDGHAIVRHLLEIREIDKIESTYLTGYDKFLWPDSRVRSSYLLTWTDSGRSSSRQPNLQNIPRKKEIRDLFGVPPGHVLLESDLSQIEFRIMVCLAQDENGIAGYLRGDDAHTMTARKIAGVETPTKEQRSNAKPVNFMFLYGGQAVTAQKIAADDYGVIWTIEQAQQFRDMFMATYPRVPMLHESTRAEFVANRGWFESIVGHRFYYEDWDHKNERKRDHAFRAFLNAKAQGPAAHIAFYIMVLARRMLDARGFETVEFVNTFHDSILTDIPREAWLPDVVAIIEEATAMAHEWVKSWFVVPLIMEHKAGESWGSLVDVHPSR